MPVIETCEPAKHLYIALPAYRGEIKAGTTVSIASAAVALTVAGVGLTFGKAEGCPYLDHTRNMLATGFLRSDATDMLFIDDDVGFPPEAAVRIARATRPFIFGIYPAKTDPIAFPVTFGVDQLWSDADGLIDSCTTAPTGFLRLNRAVFDAMPCTPYQDDAGREWLGYFDAGVRGRSYQGEDTDFAIRWRMLGGSIHLIPDITFQHTGLKTWEGNWAEWVRSRPPDLEEAA